MESILESIRKLIGPSAQYTIFDNDLIMHINSAFFTLHQLGLTEEPFVISGTDETWDEFHEKNWR